jgi:hypothetical protein
MFSEDLLSAMFRKLNRYNKRYYCCTTYVVQLTAACELAASACLNSIAYHSYFSLFSNIYKL